MDPSVRTVGTFHNEDQRWLGNGGQPIGQPRSIVLDRSAFDLVTRFPNGFIPSGVALAEITATGLYGPYGGTTEEVVTLTESGSGLTSFTITFGGQTTGAIDDDATAATVQAALEALSNVAPGDIVVTGGPLGTGPFTLTFGGAYANTNVGDVTTTPTGGTGAVDVAVVLAGGGEGGTGGLETMKGHLFASIPYDRASTGDLSAALLWNGEVIEEFLPTGHGLDPAGKAEVANHIDYV